MIIQGLEITGYFGIFSDVPPAGDVESILFPPRGLWIQFGIFIQIGDAQGRFAIQQRLIVVKLVTR